MYKFVCNHTKLILTYYLAVAPIKGFATVRNVSKPVAHEAHGVRTELLRDTSISLQVLSATIYMLIYPRNK